MSAMDEISQQISQLSAQSRSALRALTNNDGRGPRFSLPEAQTPREAINRALVGRTVYPAITMIEGDCWVDPQLISTGRAVSGSSVDVRQAAQGLERQIGLKSGKQLAPRVDQWWTDFDRRDDRCYILSMRETDGMRPGTWFMTACDRFGTPMEFPAHFIVEAVMMQTAMVRLVMPWYWERPPFVSHGHIVRLGRASYSGPTWSYNPDQDVSFTEIRRLHDNG